jgi:hypothetical protein
MPRAYTVATAALALNVSVKWLDNTVSHFRVQGVDQSRQGVARKFSIESLTILAISIAIVRDLDAPVRNAINIATQLVQSHGNVTLPGGVMITVDVDKTSALLFERLEHAVEIAPLPRRGRPPKKTTGRLD